MFRLRWHISINATGPFFWGHPVGCRISLLSLTFILLSFIIDLLYPHLVGHHILPTADLVVIHKNVDLAGVILLADEVIDIDDEQQESSQRTLEHAYLDAFSFWSLSFLISGAWYHRQPKGNTLTPWKKEFDLNSTWHIWFFFLLSLILEISLTFCNPLIPCQ